MPKFIIERDIPGAGQLSQEELKNIAVTSCNVINNIGKDIQWIESYVTGDKIYCVYLATNADVIRRHAKDGGFPANHINEVHNIISPLTAEN